jgi:hypothetical protein
LGFSPLQEYSLKGKFILEIMMKYKFCCVSMELYKLLFSKLPVSIYQGQFGYFKATMLPKISNFQETAAAILPSFQKEREREEEEEEEEEEERSWGPVTKLWLIEIWFSRDHLPSATFTWYVHPVGPWYKYDDHLYMCTSKYAAPY